MATKFASQLIYCSFVLVFFLSSETESRQSKLFFSKYVHLSKNTNNNYVTVPSTIQNKDLSKSLNQAPSPAPAPSTSYISIAPSPLGYEYASAPAPLGDRFAPAPLESENSYYGLYAKDTNTNFPSNVKPTDVDNIEEEEEFSNEELSNEVPEVLNYKESNKDGNAYSRNDLSNNNQFWTSTYKSYKTNNGYRNEPQGMSDTRLLDNDKYYYNTEREIHGRNEGYTNEPQGMSDTRLLHNGNYYNYDMDRENYGTKGDVFEMENNNAGGYYYDNNKKSRYEFDSMEEYEKQEGYTDVPQDQFIP